jgi:hypothetical protein
LLVLDQVYERMRTEREKLMAPPQEAGEDVNQTGPATNLAAKGQP